MRREDIEISDSYKKLLSENIRGINELDKMLMEMVPQYSSHFHEYIKFCACIPYDFCYNDEYSSGKNIDQKEAMVEKIAYWASLVKQGINLFGIDPEYDEIAPHLIEGLDKLPSIDYYEKINKMEDLIVENVNSKRPDAGYVLPKFIHSQNKEQLPIQGWKIHISAKDADEYLQLLQHVAKDLTAMGVPYKVVTPSEFDEFQSGPQAGKCITIYLTKDFDLQKFSNESKELLMSDSIAPTGDFHLGGRMFARYGRISGEHNLGMILNVDGYEKCDRRDIAAPDFITGYNVESILSFYSQCEDRFQQHGDLKRYLVERAMMVELPENCGDMLKEFIAIECPHEMGDFIAHDLRHPNCIIEHNGKSYLIGGHDVKHDFQHCVGSILHPEIYTSHNSYSEWEIDDLGLTDSTWASVRNEKVKFSNEALVTIESTQQPTRYATIFEVSKEGLSLIKEQLQTFIDNGSITTYQKGDDIFVRDDGLYVYDIEDFCAESITITENELCSQYKKIDADEITQGQDDPGRNIVD